jgi:transposase
MRTRNTQESLIAMKKAILDKCINKELKCKDGAKLLNLHPKSFSRLKSNYIRYGENILVPNKTGPKGSPPNKTPEYIENIVCGLAIEYSRLGPVDIADMLLEKHGIKLDQSTVFRILQRKRIRYYRQQIKPYKSKSKLYCLETPGLEVQLDACYPFGRGRKLVCFDAIDDCSRWVLAKLYRRETADNAIDFVKLLVSRAPFRVQRIRVDNRYGHKLK